MSDCCCDPPDVGIRVRTLDCGTIVYESPAGAETVYAEIPPLLSTPPTWGGGCVPPTATGEVPLVFVGKGAPCAASCGYWAAPPPIISGFEYYVHVCSIFTFGAFTAWAMAFRIGKSGCSQVVATYLSDQLDLVGSYTRNSATSWAPVTVHVREYP